MSKFAVIRGYLTSAPFRINEIERDTEKMYFFVKAGSTYYRLPKNSPKIVAIFDAKEAAEKAIKEACDRYDVRIAASDEAAKKAGSAAAALRMERVASIQMMAGQQSEPLE